MKYIKSTMLIILLVFLNACTTENQESQWEIQFHTNGGNTIESISYESEDLIILPDDPTKDGFSFDGWYTDQNLESVFDMTEMPSIDLILYAKWIPIETNQLISITYFTTNGTQLQQQEYTPGELMNAPDDPSRDGFTFIGWSIHEDCNDLYVFDTAPENNLDLYACWLSEDEDLVTITFNTSGGTTIPTLVSEPGASIVFPKSPTKDAYVFDGWYKNSTLTTPYTMTETMPLENITLYAKWIALEDLAYTVTFETNGGTYIEPITQLKGQNITEPEEPKKDEYTFIGWYVDHSLNTEYSFNNQPNQDFTLYAKWEETDTNYITISFVTNGGTSIEDLIYRPGDSSTLPKHTYKDGHLFAGWYLFPDLSRPVDLINFFVDVTLYAKWVQANNIQIITFESNGGSYVYPIHKQEGSSINEPTPPVKTGYTFDGWYTDEALTNAFGFSYMLFDDITLYAKWSEKTNSEEIISSTLRDTLEDMEFICTETICEYEISSGFTYVVHLQTGTFEYIKQTIDDQEGGYRYFDSTITIDHNWDVTYTYSVDENYGHQINTTLTMTGNVLTDIYEVTEFSSNVTTQESRESAALSSIGYFVTFVEQVLEAGNISMDDFR